MHGEEKPNGVGDKNRRLMIRLWKETGKKEGLSLKQWASLGQTGDVSFVWLEKKRAS